MLTEFVVLLATLLLQHKIHAFLAICAAFLVYGITRRRSGGDELPFVRAVGQDLGRALIACRWVFLASALIVAAAIGFVAGQWGGWLVTVVTGAAIWATWGLVTADSTTPTAASRPPKPKTATTVNET